MVIMELRASGYDEPSKSARQNKVQQEAVEKAAEAFTDAAQEKQAVVTDVAKNTFLAAIDKKYFVTDAEALVRARAVLNRFERGAFVDLAAQQKPPKYLAIMAAAVRPSACWLYAPLPVAHSLCCVVCLNPCHAPPAVCDRWAARNLVPSSQSTPRTRPGGQTHQAASKHGRGRVTHSNTLGHHLTHSC